MGEIRTTKGLFSEARMLGAEKLLKWAQKVAPMDHPDSRKLNVAILRYFEATLEDRQQ